MTNFQMIIEIVGIATEVLLLGIVSLRRTARDTPTFLFYVYWATLSDVLGAMCYYTGWKGYLAFYDMQSAVNELLLIAILFDLARSAVRPLPTAVSRAILGLLAFVTVAAGATIWRVSDSWALLSHYLAWHLLLRVQLTSSLVRVLLLLLLGALVEFLSRHYVPVGWGETQLQIATGMGIYALASVAESLATTYQPLMTPAMYPRIALGVAITFELCMVYWIISFLRPERGPSGHPDGPAEVGSSSDSSTLWPKETEGNFDGRGNQLVGEAQP